MMCNDIKNTARISAILGCVALLGGCYSSSGQQAFFADPPPPPVIIPDTPRETITTLRIEPYTVASLEPSAGELAVYLDKEECKTTSTSALGYQWGKNSVGVDVERGATLRYSLSLGEDVQFKKPCEAATSWNGFAYEGYNSVFDR